MKIGIDLDNTISETGIEVEKNLKIYAKENNINYQSIMKDNNLKNDFFNKRLQDIYKNVGVKKDASKVINKLIDNGNEIYIITARSNNLSNVEELTKEWLNKNNILYTKLIINSYGEEKANVCKKNNIDLMIDDNEYNYNCIKSIGINCLLFNNSTMNWLEIEKYIERMII